MQRIRQPALTILAALLAGLSTSAFAASDIVISQVYSGGGGTGTTTTWKRDFVELFNRSGAPVNLKGMSLQYQAATGTSWAGVALPDKELKPGQYFLVAAGQAGTAGADLQDTDLSFGSSLAAGAGKVALASIPTGMTTPAC